MGRQLGRRVDERLVVEGDFDIGKGNAGKVQLGGAVVGRGGVGRVARQRRWRGCIEELGDLVQGGREDFDVALAAKKVKRSGADATRKANDVVHAGAWWWRWRECARSRSTVTDGAGVASYSSNDVGGGVGGKAMAMAVCGIKLDSIRGPVNERIVYIQPGFTENQVMLP